MRSRTRGWSRLIVSFIVGLALGAAWAEAQPRGGNEGATWPVGTWIGVFEGREKTRTLIVDEITGPDSGRGRYGITGDRMGHVALTLSRSGAGETVVAFETPGQPPARMILTRATDFRMEGRAERGRGSRPIRFWRTAERPADPVAASFLGTWEGRWRNGLEARLQVEYADTQAASVLYWWGDLPAANTREDWSRHNATIVDDVLEFATPDGLRVFRIKAGSSGRLTGICQPCRMDDGRDNDIIWFPAKR